MLILMKKIAEIMMGEFGTRDKSHHLFCISFILQFSLWLRIWRYRPKRNKKPGSRNLFQLPVDVVNLQHQNVYRTDAPTFPAENPV